MDKIRMYQVWRECLKGQNKGKHSNVGNDDVWMTHGEACHYKWACDSRPDLNRLYLIER